MFELRIDSSREALVRALASLAVALSFSAVFVLAGFCGEFGAVSRSLRRAELRILRHIHTLGAWLQ